MDTLNLKLPEYYINRELSQLEFNRRVLEQARNPCTPLLERLKFLCISSTNLDEFFEIRVAGLKQRGEIGTTPTGPDNLSPSEALQRIRETTLTLVSAQYAVLNNELIPELRDAGICFLRRDEWTAAQGEWLEHYLHTEVVPVLSPTTLDPTRPIPRILNKSLNFIVGLHGDDAFGRPSHRAIVQAPRSLPRLISLPAQLGTAGAINFVFLSSVIHAFVGQLFTGMEIDGCYQFRITRNSDLYVDDEDIDDLMGALQGELFENRYGAAVRLETPHDCPAELSDYLLKHFELGEDDLYLVGGPVNLNRLLTVYELADRDDLKFPPFVPGMPKAFDNQKPFAAIAKRDILVHHPYESFAPVIDFIHRAATDPQVLAIKQTLYRTTPNSPLVASLVSAAKAGKEVTVLIELRARFDEAANIELASKLQGAGAHVVYGVVGYKTHCKMALVVRRERGKLRRYVHISTGNYHPKTARVYTDYGLFSADATLGEDVHQVFMQLTSLMRTANLERLLQSPFTLHTALIGKIRREARIAGAGGRGRIIAKLNALVEPAIIRTLYEASMAGVEIDLVVRGVCCLRPRVAGLSDNIRVRSIVGRFLEHSRVYYFANGGDDELYCASADWMDRNFFRRIEVAFPILDPRIKRRLCTDLDAYLTDNTDAWELRADGTYASPAGSMGVSPVAVQARFLATLAEPA